MSAEYQLIEHDISAWVNAHLPRLSKISGMRKFRSDHSSAMLFCSGVPVNSKRFADLYNFSSLHKQTANCHSNTHISQITEAHYIAIAPFSPHYITHGAAVISAIVVKTFWLLQNKLYTSLIHCWWMYHHQERWCINAPLDGDEWRKDKHRPLVVVSALCFLLSFDTGWVTGKIIQSVKTCATYLQSFPILPVQEVNQGRTS